jgi:hypothetical protein
MPEPYEHLNPMPFEAAVQMELELAEDLRAAGIFDLTTYFRRGCSYFLSR